MMHDGVSSTNAMRKIGSRVIYANTINIVSLRLMQDF